jgi:mannitol/fructose-specific phosphotransferase system IIA component (Ntr-type)
MQITHYISPREIIIPLQGVTKQDIYKELVDHLAELSGLTNSEELFQAIMNRENSASTFLPMGIAVPHARVAGIDEIKLVVGVSPQPIRDTGIEALPLTAQVFLLFFSPTEEKVFGRHLKLLSRIAAVFSEPELVAEIAGLDSGSAVFERIQRREREISEE